MGIQVVTLTEFSICIMYLVLLIQKTTYEFEMGRCDACRNH